MKKYTVIRKPPVLNWNQVPKIHMEYMDWTPLADISATAQLCYDEEALYVCMEAKEADIRAEYKGRLDLPCLDSCLEFFFKPEAEDERYINIEWNPNCCLYCGIGMIGGSRIRLFPEDTDVFCPKVTYREDGWKITYQVPVTFLNNFFPEFTLSSGKVISANFYKCGEETKKRHYLAWNKVMSKWPDFHRPQDFGVLELI